MAQPPASPSQGRHGGFHRASRPPRRRRIYCGRRSFREKEDFVHRLGDGLGFGWSPDGTEIWFSSTRLGYGRYLSAINLSGKERLLAREPGTLTLQDVARDGRVLIARDVPRVGMVGLSAASAKMRDLSWLDWSAPKDL